MSLLNRDGVNIYYEVHGSGPTILLTHGYSADTSMWKPQIEALSKNYRLVLWDMRGHGRSDYPEDPKQYSETATLDDMAAILDAVGAERAVIGGLSLGGYMSLAFHLKYPHRVRALLIIDTGPGYRKDAPRAGWNATAEEMAKKLESDGLDYLRQLSPERATSHHRSADGLIKAARGMLTQHDSRVIESLTSIKVPSIVIVGANDEPFLNSSDYMAAKIPGARKAVIADAGHASNIDQPAKFNGEVLQFLANLG